MHSEIHRATRFPFAANVEVTDVRSERIVTGRTSDLSVFGCHVRTTNPFPVGTKITLRITHDGATFAKVEPTHQAILEKWIANLRKK
jgi:D-serine deaminase-like pyridoxal phosphate-dependent protein